MAIVDNFQLLKIRDSTEILLNADIGNIYLNPSKEIVGHFKEREKER